MLPKAIQTRHNGISKFSLIVADITQIILFCVNFEVKFVRRQANMVAHAQTANSWANFHRIEIAPLCIERLLVLFDSKQKTRFSIMRKFIPF
jgi:hypothetical protein